MLCPYIRSSSLNQFKFCQMRYLFEYLFCLPGKSGAKALKGTIFHKCQELRAQASTAIRDKKKSYIDDNFDKVLVKNATDIDWCLDQAFEYYSTKDPELGLVEKDKKEIRKWITDTLENYPHYDPLKMNILQTEQKFDIEIREDWAKYKGIVKGVEHEGYLSIKGTIDSIIKLDDNTYEMLDYKGLPIDTPIPTPEGFKTMGELAIGDVVFDQFGKKCKITNKSSQIFKPCYELTFDDTSKVICDNEHYWKLDNGFSIQVKKLKIGDKINIAKPIDCNSIALPIDPYVLGVWLGDGRRRSGEIASADQFVFDEIERRGFKIGKNISSNKTSICKQRTVGGLTKLLNKNNLLYNKHIPKIYLRASYAQRLELLQGLMDSDGSVNIQRKQCVFTNCNKNLSEDVVELLLTLGQRPLLSKVKTVCKTQNYIGVGYPVSFRPININPFLLEIKLNKINKNWGSGLSSKRKIISIEKIKKRLTQCITVDSQDSTYLCTKKFIPTHNSGTYRTDFATGELKDSEYLKNDIQLLMYLVALDHLYPGKDWILSLFYIRAGGIFSVHGDKEMLQRAKDTIKKYFKEISACEAPTQFDPSNKSWKCKHLCPFSKPLSEYRGQSMCQHYKGLIDRKGIQIVQDSIINEKKLFSYGSGGGRSASE